MISYIINKLISKVFGSVLKILIDFVITPIMEVTYVVTVTSVAYFAYNISTMMLSIIDFLSDMFRMFAGVSEGLYFSSLTSAFSKLPAGENMSYISNDLLIQLITSEQVMEVFASVFIAGLFLIMVCTFVSIIKQEFNSEKANKKSQILAKTLKSLLNMILVPVICIFGTILANRVLSIIDKATGGSDNITISGVIFSAATIDAYYGGDLNYAVSLTNPLDTAVNGGMSAVVGTLIDNIAKLVSMDSDTEKDLENVVGAIFGFQDPHIMIENNNTLYVGGATDPVISPDKYGGDSAKAEQIVGAYKEFISTMYTYVSSHSYLSRDKDGNIIPIDCVFGNYYATNFGTDTVKIYDNKRDKDGNFTRVGNTEYLSVSLDNTGLIANMYLELGDNSRIEVYKSYYNAYQVSADFHPARINYFMIMMCAGFIIKTLFSAIVGLMMRVYQGISLFILLPAVIGISPLDEGGAFNKWKSQFISQVVGAYSSILAVNLFLMLCGWFMGINLAYIPANAIPQSTELADITYLSVSFLLNANMISSVFKLLFVLTGSLMIQDFSKLIAEILGLFDVMGEGSSMVNSVKDLAGQVAKMGAGVAAGGAALSGKAFTGLANKTFTTASSIKTNGFKKTMGAGIGKITNPFKRGSRVLGAFKLTPGGLKSKFGAAKAANAAFTRSMPGGERALLAKAAKGFAKKNGVLFGNIRANRNLSFAAQKAVLDEYDEAHMGLAATTGALSDFDKEHGIDGTNEKWAEGLDATVVSQREALLENQKQAQARVNNITPENAEKFLKEGSSSAEIQERILETKVESESQLKTNMVWGMESLASLLPGLKTLKGMKEDRESAVKEQRKKNETMDALADMLEEMHKDELKDKDKKRHADVHAESARIAGLMLKKALEEEAKRTYEEDKKAADQLTNAIKKAYELKDMARVGYYQQMARDRGFNAVEKNGQVVQFTSNINPIKIDVDSIFKGASSEKEVYDAFKKAITTKNKEEAKIMMRVVERFRSQMDKK